MRNLVVLILCVVLFNLSFAAPQDQSAAQANAEKLRAQLLDVETKQSGLQTRLQDVEEKLKPENIEKALAGLGSTRPEEVREQRRRELEIERNGLRTQLDLLATSHTRLETAIARADAEAYRQSAAPSAEPAATVAGETNSAAASPAPAPSTPIRPRRAKKKRSRKSKRIAIPKPGF